jgi:hypothetical protein
MAELSRSAGMLYPGTSRRVHFELDTLPPGAYQVLVVADTGEPELVGAQYRLRL